MTDHADIKARLEAHKAHVAELGWSRDVPAETWARDVHILLAALDERDKAITLLLANLEDLLGIDEPNHPVLLTPEGTKSIAESAKPLYEFREA